MNESFKELREIAAKKRDKAIKTIKAEYNETIQKIAEVEARLREPRKRPNARPGKPRIADKIFEALPTDKTFTLNDVMGTLKASHPDRKWNRQSVYVVINRLMKQGAIKQISRAGHKRAAVYALADTPFEPAKTMLDWAKEVEGWETMKPVELMVKMTEAGYEMEVAPPDAVRSLERELSKITHRL